MFKQLNKTRNEQIKQVLMSTLEDREQIQKILDALHAIFSFDPNANTYNPKAYDYIKRYRQKKLDEGVSMYESSGKKAWYEKNRKTHREITVE